MIENANEKQIEAEKLLNYINSSLENAK